MSKPVVFFVAGLLFFLGVALGRCAPGSTAAPTRPAPTATAPIAVLLTPPPTALPAPTGQPLRVQFPRGSYGATVTGTGSARYLLWAKAGQQFSTALLGSGESSLYSVDGAALYEQAPSGAVVKVTLVADGDHLLDVRASGAYTLGIEIR